MFKIEDYMGAIVLLMMTARALPRQMMVDFIPVLQDCKEKQNAMGNKPDEATVQYLCNSLNEVCEKHGFPPICVPDSIEIKGPFSSMDEAEAASAVAH